jgi:hypothetical protein
VFKRLFWLTVGVSAGFGGSYWIQRRIRHAVDRLAPEHVQEDVKAAWAEGRIAMRTRELELRRRYQRPSGPAAAHR